MGKLKSAICIMFAIIGGMARDGFAADQWRIGEGGQWKEVGASKEEQYLARVAEIKRLVDGGQHSKAKKAAERLKKDYPEIAGKDFDAYMAAEILLARKKVAKAVRGYDKFLDEYPQSGLKDAAMERLFDIGSAYLGGRKKNVLFFRVRGYDDGVKIMEKLSDRAGNTEMGKRSAVAIAESYEKRKKYNEAYLQWSDVSSRWPTGEMGRISLLGMARNKYASHQGRDFDASSLISARSYYENYRLRYPDDAEQIGAAKIVEEIDVKLAAKNLSIGNYYNRTGNREAASMYYQMVTDKWPQSEAAKSAAEQKSKPPPQEEKDTWIKAIGRLLL